MSSWLSLTDLTQVDSNYKRPIFTLKNHILLFGSLYSSFSIFLKKNRREIRSKRGRAVCKAQNRDP